MKQFILRTILALVAVTALAVTVASADPVASQVQSYPLKVQLDPGDSYTLEFPSPGWILPRVITVTATNTSVGAGTSVTNGTVYSIATNGVATTYIFEFLDASHPGFE